jgi:hypothetical protein
MMLFNGSAAQLVAWISARNHTGEPCACDLPKVKVMKLAEIAKMALLVTFGSIQKQPVTIWLHAQALPVRCASNPGYFHPLSRVLFC